MQATKQQTAPVDLPETSGLGFYAALIVLFAGGLLAFYLALLPKQRKHEAVLSETRDLAVVRVRVARPSPAPLAAALSLSGELKPLAEASILSRVQGFVRSWSADMGDKVAAGQVLAELDTPELQRETARAAAQLALAEVAKHLAETTAKRWEELFAAQTASKQALDEKQADFELKCANVDAARAEVQRLQQIVQFANITAPFDGTITSRRLDVGQLVEAGGSKELYRISDSTKLRVLVRVPQAYARSVKKGQLAEVTVPELRGKTFKAQVVRIAGSIDAASRTMLVELEVENSDGLLFAGSYAQVLMPSAQVDAPLTVPANALIFRSEGAQVALVDPSGMVTLAKVVLGRDFGNAVELIEGVTAEHRVVLNPPDSLADGQKVEVVE